MFVYVLPICTQPIKEAGFSRDLIKLGARAYKKVTIAQEIAWLEHFEEFKEKQFYGLEWVRKINEKGRLLCIELKMKVGKPTLSLSQARAQSCLILCDPMDFSPPGSSVQGTF